MITKATLLKVHKWIGLFATLFIFIQIITGMMLVYRWELAQWLDQEGMVRTSSGANISVDKLIDVLDQELPELSVKRIFYPPSDRANYFVQMGDDSGGRYYAAVDPGNGELRRFGSLWQFPVEVALKLHYQPLPGKSGLVMVIVVGAAFLSLAISGIWYWLQAQRGRLRSSLKISRGLNSKRLMRQSHRSVGIVTAPVILLIVSTGLLIEGDILFASPAPVSNLPSAPPVEAVVDHDAAIDAAMELFPGAEIRDVRIRESSVLVNFLETESDPFAVDQVVVGLADSRVYVTTPASENEALWMALLPIHTGTFLGSTGKLLVLLSGLATLCLGVLGWIMWMQKRPGRAVKK